MCVVKNPFKCAKVCGVEGKGVCQVLCLFVVVVVKICDHSCHQMCGRRKIVAFTPGK